VENGKLDASFPVFSNYVCASNATWIIEFAIPGKLQPVGFANAPIVE
jgi:hypothetical protein